MLKKLAKWVLKAELAQLQAETNKLGDSAIRLQSDKKLSRPDMKLLIFGHYRKISKILEK